MITENQTKQCEKCNSSNFVHLVRVTRFNGSKHYVAFSGWLCETHREAYKAEGYRVNVKLAVS